MPGPDVQQLPGGGGLTSYSFCTCPLYFAWVFLSYLMPSHFIGSLSLGPCILFYFFRGSTPPSTTQGSCLVHFQEPILTPIQWFHVLFCANESEMVLMNPNELLAIDHRPCNPCILFPIGPWGTGLTPSRQSLRHGESHFFERLMVILKYSDHLRLFFRTWRDSLQQSSFLLQFREPYPILPVITPYYPNQLFRDVVRAGTGSTTGRHLAHKVSSYVPVHCSGNRDEWEWWIKG